MGIISALAELSQNGFDNESQGDADFDLAVDQAWFKADVQEEVRNRRAAFNFKPPPIGRMAVGGDILGRDEELPEGIVMAEVDGKPISLWDPGTNVVFVGDGKVGKTTTTLAVIRALIQTQDFGRVARRRRVGLWSLEMTPDGRKKYMRPMGFDDRAVNARLSVFDGRGYPINILTLPGRRWTVRLLQICRVQTWVIDSLARLARAAGVDENSNAQMAQLLETLEDIKTEAGAREIFVIHHTGKDGDDARGAAFINNWADFIWTQTANRGRRFLRTTGRDRDLPKTELSWDEDTRLVSLGTTPTDDVGTDKAQTVMLRVVDFVREHPGEFNKRGLIAAFAALKIRGMQMTGQIGKAIDEGVERELLTVQKTPRGFIYDVTKRI